MAGDPRPQKELNRLKLQVRQLQKEKEKFYPELGKAVYQAFVEGRLTDPGLVQACEQVKALDVQAEQANAEIARLQAAIQQMKAAPPAPAVTAGARCPACGAPLTPGLKFCGNCGAPQQIAGPTPAAGVPCTSCGHPVAAGVRFCGECGQPVDAVASPPPPPAVQAPVPPAAPTPPSPPAPPQAPPAVEAGRKCPSCGAAVEEEGGAFCGECGARL